MLDTRNFLMPLALAGLGVVAALTMFSMRDMTIRLSRTYRHLAEQSSIDSETDDEKTKTITFCQWIACPVETIAIYLAVLTTVLSIALVEIGSGENVSFQLLQCVISVLIFAQTAAVLVDRDTTTKYYKGLRAALSCLTSIFVLGIHSHVLSATEGWASTLFTFDCVQILTTALIAVCCLVLPRAPDIYHNEVIVDRQHATSFISRWSYSWAADSIQTIKRSRCVALTDLPELDRFTRARGLNNSFSKNLATQAETRLWQTLLHSQRRSILSHLLVSSISTAVAFAPQFFLFRLLQVLESGPGDGSTGMLSAGLIALIGLSMAVASSLNMWKSWLSCNIIQIRVFSQMSAMLFDKTVQGGIPAQEKPNVNINRLDDNDRSAEPSVINLVATDARQISEFLGEIYKLWEIPLQAVTATTLLIGLLGWLSVLAGLGTLISTMLLTAFILRRYVCAQGAVLDARDQKTSSLTELLNSIRLVKFLAMEDKWEHRIRWLRGIEVQHQSRGILWEVALTSVFLAEPIFLSMVALSTFALLSGHMSASTAFTSVTLLAQLERALNNVPDMLTAWSKATVSMDRIYEYLNSTQPLQLLGAASHIELNHATVCWPGARYGFRLNDVTLIFPQGARTIIAGGTGSGKSLLLAAILGESDVRHGTVGAPREHAAQSFAYVSQQPWVEGGTVRHNILFGSPFRADRYREVLFACALGPDLESLSEGDQTTVGQNGISLSGGQKARLSLARALYSDSSVLILDDVLSAVDGGTAHHLVEFALNGKLAMGRTCILATYHVDLCMSGTSYLVSLDGHGSYSAHWVDNIQNDPYRVSHNQQHLLNDSSGQCTRSTTKCSSDTVAPSTEPTEPNGSSSITDVEGACRKLGAPSMEVIRRFITWCATSYTWSLVCGLFVVASIVMTAQAYVIKIWTQEDRIGPEYRAQRMRFIHLYIVLSVAAVVLGSVRNYVVLMLTFHGSQTLFQHLLHVILRARLRWLDMTPIGSLISRLSVDCAVLDTEIGQDVRLVMAFSLNLTMAIISSIFVNPVSIGCAIPTLLLSLWYADGYLKATREIKRLESIALGPIFNHFITTVTGLVTVRAFGRVESYRDIACYHIDSYSRAVWHRRLLDQWIGFRMGLIGAFFSASTAGVVVLAKGWDASSVGFVVSFTIRLADHLSALLRAYTSLEMDLNSLERLLEYCNIETEKDTPAHCVEWTASEGRLEVTGLKASYTPELSPVLNGVTFQASPRQRIGIVGRTGAGKSSLSLALTRFIDIQPGMVKVDGVDITQVSLGSLRRQITLIPQTPILFSGTIRSNLDPFGKQDDCDLHKALKSVHWPWNSGPQDNDAVGVLDTIITAEGSNISQGQRQLLCLARATVSRTPIVVLDETTSSLDQVTDRLIQKSIREAFPETTILAIAHRLQSIADFDRVLVLQQGRTAEFGSPAELMVRENGIFRAMVEADAESAVVKEIIWRGG